MQQKQAAVAAAVVIAVMVLARVPTTEAFNITRMLAKYPEFSTFSHYLTVTHLADDINNRRTITVCVVDNPGMADLLSHHYSLATIKNVLAVHVFLDYFGAKKLHQITNGTALTATMFQATGTAPGSSGFVNITDLKGGKVGFGAVDNGGTVDATFVKSVEEQPYNISVIQISNILPSPDAEAPTAAPAQVNITDAMSAHGCKVFAETLLASPAEKTYEDNLQSGLTIFCPDDDAMKKFLPKFKNLSADDQQSLLQFHAIPIYLSFSGLKSNNGPTNTLATDGDNKYSLTVQNDGQGVTVKTPLDTAKITANLLDQDPLSIFTVNKVLRPPELFKSELAPTPAPAPAPAPGKSTPKHKSPPAPASPAESPADGPAADQTADTKNGAVVLNSGGFVGVCLMSLWFAFLLF